MRSKLKRFLVWLNIAVILATIFAHISSGIDPEKTIFFGFFGLAYLGLFIANVVFVIFWLMTRPRLAWMSLVMIIVGWFIGCDTFVWQFDGAKNKDKNQILLISYNMQHAQLGWVAKGVRQTVKQYKAELSKLERPQIFCAQETRGNAQKYIKEIFQYQNHHIIKDKGAAIFTDFPIVNKGEIDFGTKTNSCLWADIVLDSDTVRLYNVHLQSNQISKDAEKMADEGSLQESKTWIGMRSIMGKYRHFTLKRAKQVALIRRHLEKSPHPVILCGDLNDIPKSYVIAEISKNLKDSFEERGKGIGTTYAGVIPALRIDYVLVGQKISVLDHQVKKIELSDHFPVEVLIEI